MVVRRVIRGGSPCSFGCAEEEQMDVAADNGAHTWPSSPMHAPRRMSHRTGKEPERRETFGQRDRDRGSRQTHSFDGNVASAARPSFAEEDGMMRLIRLPDFQAQFGLHQPYRKLAKPLQIAGTFSRQNWMGLRWSRPSSLPLGPHCYEMKCLRQQAQTCLIKMRDLSHVQQSYTDSPQRGQRHYRKCTSLARHLLGNVFRNKHLRSRLHIVDKYSKNPNKNVPALTCLTFTLTFQTSTFQQAPQENKNKEEEEDRNRNKPA